LQIRGLGWDIVTVKTAAPEGAIDVRFGSKADICSAKGHVRFTLKSGHTLRRAKFSDHDFSHPISHRTPHYRVGNGGIGWSVINQKRLNFQMQRH
jgi:hypothetical protein